VYRGGGNDFDDGGSWETGFDLFEKGSEFRYGFLDRGVHCGAHEQPVVSPQSGQM
jgi:hypothetical protein